MKSKDLEGFVRISCSQTTPTAPDLFDFEKRGELYGAALKRDLAEDELKLLAQLQSNQLLYRQNKFLKTIKNILVFFCTLTCISLTVVLLSIVLDISWNLL